MTSNNIRYYRACAHTLLFAYNVGLISWVVSIIVGIFYHPVFILTLLITLLFLVLRYKWYHEFNRP